MIMARRATTRRKIRRNWASSARSKTVGVYIGGNLPTAYLINMSALQQIEQQSPRGPDFSPIQH